jgi:hypothetical protein
MNAILKSMQKKNSGIPEDVLPVFEGIIQKGTPCLWGACDDEFSLAMEEHLTQEHRFRLFERHGSCMGTGYDKERKAFALEHANLALDERMELFAETFGRQKPVLNDDNTLTLTFKCTHGYYKCVRDKKILSLPPAVKPYFERCAGGRLYELQKALGVTLKIKSVDISPLNENLANPVVFTFEIVGR